jgi:hypothetical protein
MQPMGLDECDSRFIHKGWYQYPGGQNIPTHPVIPGQCGTNSPIYLQGTVVVTLRCYDTSFIQLLVLLPYIKEAVLHCCDISGTDDGGVVVWISDMVWSVGMSVDSIAN